ncbi:PorV/PorQ family protein [candidate division WOR-3 bacterium]|nr:PorV/PorQ family protein [candidate division WOR-3 bacterium]
MRRSFILFAVGVSLIGSSLDPGGVFLMIFPGSRATALGGAFCAVEGDVYGTYYNNASLAFVKNRYLGLQHTSWLPGLYPGMYYEYFSGVYPIKDKFVTTFALTYITTGETYIDSIGGVPVEPFINYDLAVKLAVAQKFNENYGVSFGIKYIFSFLAPDWLVRAVAGKGGGQGRAWAVDASAFYKAKNNLNFGLALQNFGTSLQFVEGGERDPLPRTLRVGVAYVPFENTLNRFMITSDLIKILVNTTTNFHDEWIDTWKAIGIEYSFSNMLNARLGYFIDNNGKRLGPTFGAGFSYRNFRFDIGIDSKIYDFPTSNYRISAQYSF